MQLARYDKSNSWIEAQTQANFDYGLGLAAFSDAEGNISYFDTGLSGDVTALSGPTGQPTESLFYLPFGQVTQTCGTASDPFEFAGGFGNPSMGSGLVDMRARFYDPATGRFISPDPSELIGGTDFYAYTSNSPIGSFDPLGVEAIDLSDQDLSVHLRRS